MFRTQQRFKLIERSFTGYGPIKFYSFSLANMWTVAVSIRADNPSLSLEGKWVSYISRLFNISELFNLTQWPFFRAIFSFFDRLGFMNH